MASPLTSPNPRAASSINSNPIATHSWDSPGVTSRQGSQGGNSSGTSPMAASARPPNPDDHTWGTNTDPLDVTLTYGDHSIRDDIDSEASSGPSPPESDSEADSDDSDSDDNDTTPSLSPPTSSMPTFTAHPSQLLDDFNDSTDDDEHDAVPAAMLRPDLHRNGSTGQTDLHSPNASGGNPRVSGGSFSHSAGGLLSGSYGGDPVETDLDRVERMTEFQADEFLYHYDREDVAKNRFWVDDDPDGDHMFDDEVGSLMQSKIPDPFAEDSVESTLNNNNNNTAHLPQKNPLMDSLLSPMAPSTGSGRRSTPSDGGSQSPGTRAPSMPPPLHPLSPSNPGSSNMLYNQHRRQPSDSMSMMQTPSSLPATPASANGSPKGGNMSFNSQGSPKLTASQHTPSGSTILSPWKTPTSGSEPSTPSIRFKKGKLLGKGAFGSVYQGMDVLGGRLIAVKEMTVSDDTDIADVKEIQREIDVNVKLPLHENCVKYLGTARTKHHIYILMEYVSGGSIASLLKSVGRFHEATIRNYAYSILNGLKHLHDNGILHQDIKGANVLIDERGIAKIADFGCSRDTSKFTVSIKAVGTPLWMAPEVCRAEPATIKSDVWSFGCMMIEMAAESHLPWGFTRGTSPLQVLYAISNAQRHPPIPDVLSPMCRDFIASCLRIDPHERLSVDQLLMHPFFTASSTFQEEAEGVHQFIGDSPATSANNRIKQKTISSSNVDDTLVSTATDDTLRTDSAFASSAFSGIKSDELEETETINGSKLLPGARAPIFNPLVNPADQAVTSLSPTGSPAGKKSQRQRARTDVQNNQFADPYASPTYAGGNALTGAIHSEAGILTPGNSQSIPPQPPTARQQPQSQPSPAPAPVNPTTAAEGNVVWYSRGEGQITPGWKMQQEVDVTHRDVDREREKNRPATQAAVLDVQRKRQKVKPKQHASDSDDEKTKPKGLADRLRCMF